VNVRRAIVLSFVLLWLPVQGLAAVAMPFCQHALGHSAAVQTSGADNDHQHHGQHHHHDKHSSNADHSRDLPTGLSCNDCGSCHLACSPVVPCAIVAVLPSWGHVYNPRLLASDSLFIPEQLKPPPLTAIV